MFKRLLLLLILSITVAQATVATRSNVTHLYIANFNRAPDSAGLEYWVDKSKLFFRRDSYEFL